MGMALSSYDEDEMIYSLERQVFDEHNAYLKEKSRAEGIQKRIARDIELEIEGIEDIIEFLEPEVASAIKERITRMRRILKGEY